jgi:hypothetical protein
VNCRFTGSAAGNRKSPFSTEEASAEGTFEPIYVQRVLRQRPVEAADFFAQRRLAGVQSILPIKAPESMVMQWIVYSDKTDAYISDISMETSQLIGRESPATVADRL